MRGSKAKQIRRLVSLSESSDRPAVSYVRHTRSGVIKLGNCDRNIVKRIKSLCPKGRSVSQITMAGMAKAGLSLRAAPKPGVLPGSTTPTTTAQEAV